MSSSPLKVALIGNPNTGKSTLFNALTGFQSRVGNFPGVTVEKKIGRVRWGEREVDLIDLPGTYSLAPRSLDEMVSVNVLLGRQSDVGVLDAVVCILDASNLERNLYLASQVLDIGLPAVFVLNMSDIARERGIEIDAAQLEQRLGVPVVTTSAHRKQGVEAIRGAVERAIAAEPRTPVSLFPAPFAAACQDLRQKLVQKGVTAVPDYLVARLILDVGGWLEEHLVQGYSAELHAIRAQLAQQNCKVPVIEARLRYAWARQILTGVVTHPTTRAVTFSDKVDRWLTHRVWGLVAFLAVMFLIFQTLYTWAEPLMALCEYVQGLVSNLVTELLPPGPFRSLLADGVIAGVGGVLIFLPQICLLFLFIAVLEDCGYLARAAFLMDKLMTKIGLSGKSFVPLMSSFACAVPGIMATRVIESRRDRMVTILIAPLMSCSARLPVYLLLISAFVPDDTYAGGWLTLRGLTLMGITLFGALVSIPVAWILKRTFFKGEPAAFVMELPSYKWPSAWIVLRRMYEQGKAFVTQAGTLIFAMSIVIWAAGYFPGDHRPADQLEVQISQMEAEHAPVLEERTKIEEQLAELEATSPTADVEQQTADLTVRQAKLNTTLKPLDDARDQLFHLQSNLLEQSYLGRLGHAIEPAVRPLGWDWRIGVGVIASFPAREVIIATLGTIYSLGSDVDEESSTLKETLQNSTWPDGRPVYSLPVALSIMVFFALCAQCVSTLLIIKRETNSWFWLVFTFVYMTGLAYLAAWVAYNLALWLF